MATARPLDEQRTSRIVRDPRVLNGEPIVVGTRVPVRSIVVGSRRYAGDLARVCQAYRIDLEAVQDALAFYATHRREIDDLIRLNDAAAER